MPGTRPIAGRLQSRPRRLWLLTALAGICAQPDLLGVTSIVVGDDRGEMQRVVDAQLTGSRGGGDCLQGSFGTLDRHGYRVSALSNVCTSRTPVIIRSRTIPTRLRARRTGCADSKLFTQMPPQRRRHHPHRVRQPSAHAQKPALQH